MLCSIFRNNYKISSELALGQPNFLKSLKKSLLYLNFGPKISKMFVSFYCKSDFKVNIRGMSI